MKIMLKVVAMALCLLSCGTQLHAQAVPAQGMNFFLGAVSIINTSCEGIPPSFGGYVTPTGVIITCQGTVGTRTWQQVSGGSLTNFASGNLTPLFITSVSASSTSPVQSYALINAAAHSFFGNAAGSTGVPAYAILGAQDVSPASYVAGGGTAQAQTASYTPAVTSLVNGLRVCWQPAAANTAAAPTLAINGLAAKPITKNGTTALIANDITTTAIACVMYDGTELQLQNPQTVTSGGVTTFNSRSGAVTPTMGDYTVAQVTNGVGNNQANTYTAGAQNFASAASLTVPSTAPGSPAAGNFWNLSGTLQYFDGTVTRNIASSPVCAGCAGFYFWAAGTGPPTIPANSFGITMPTTYTTSLAIEPPNTQPAANQMMVFPAPTSNISQWAWKTNPNIRSCDVPIGDESGSAITNGQLGPQSRMCYIPQGATVLEVDVNADAGTPNIIVARNSAGTISNLLSGALATAASGGIACSNTGGTTGLNGVTTCAATLQNTTLAAGDYIELVSGTAGGTAKLMVVHIIYQI